MEEKGGGRWGERPKQPDHWTTTRGRALPPSPLLCPPHTPVSAPPIKHTLTNAPTPLYVSSPHSAEANDIIDAPRYTPPSRPPTSTIPCYDPATMQTLGTMPAMSPDDVRAAIAKCRVAQAEWSKTTFAQRRRLMRVLLQYVVNNQETLCR